MAESQIVFYKHEQGMVHVHDNCTKYEQNHDNFSEIQQQSTQNLGKNCHNYSNLAQSQILCYMHQQPMVPNHSTRYEENPSTYHGGISNDGQTDGQTGSVPIISDSATREWGITSLKIIVNVF